MSVFSEKLRQALDKNNMSQSELAILIGKNKASVSQYLSGKNSPRLEVLRNIEAVLGPITDSYIEETRTAICENRVSPETTAKRLGISPQAVRVALQQGTAPYGYAWKVQSKWSYHISPKLLNEYIGKEENNE